MLVNSHILLSNCLHRYNIEIYFLCNGSMNMILRLWKGSSSLLYANNKYIYMLDIVPHNDQFILQ